MTISVARLAAIVLPLLLATLYLLYILDRRLLHQYIISIARGAATLTAVAAMLHYVFLIDRPLLSLAWIVLFSGVAAAVYCRRRWLGVPLFVGSTLSTLVVAIYVLDVFSCSHLFGASPLVPLQMTLLTASLYIGRRGLTAYVMNKRVHQSLDEYLMAMGHSPWQTLRPFIAAAISRALAAVLSASLRLGVVITPGIFVGLLFCGVAPMTALMLTISVLMASLFAAIASLLLAIYVYNRLSLP